MIGRLRGVLAVRRGGEVVVDVGGVGYRVAVPPGCHLPPVGDDVVIHTHTYVREDTLALYGFPSEADRDLFELLLACQGVGPKVALACLSVLSADALSAAVASEDLATLCLVPGIGKRSAEKLVFELRPRLGAVGSGGGAGVGSRQSEVRDALGSLGYGEKEVTKVLAGLPADGDTTELLRAALKVLGRSDG